MANVMDFGADREDIQSGNFVKLKVAKGEEKRIGIIVIDEAKKIMFRGTKVHCGDGLKTFVCKSTADKKEICCTHSYSGNKAKHHIGCVTVVYKFSKEGSKLKLIGYDLLPWIFWSSVYMKLRTIDKEFPIVSHDLTLKGTNDEYGTLDITICKESYWQSSPKLKAKIIEEAQGPWEDIASNLGAELSLGEIRELLSIENEATKTMDAAVDIGDVIDMCEV